MSMLRGTGMALYNLSLSPASAISHAVFGNFSASKLQEIVVVRGGSLQLLRPDESRRVQIISSTDVFGQIRSLATFRLPGTPTDYIAIGSDSGRIVILQFSAQKRAFIKVHQETFGRSGCRRIVPGQYIACDPAGRAVMVAAVEKQKFVYVLNRDAANKLTISSPLEAHKSRHIVFALTALDNGFENPMFAAIELDYSDADEDPTGEAASQAQKHLVFYELDLGINHVTRRWSEPCDNGANMLIPVPGDSLKVKAEDMPGPGGVLLCAENFIMYMNEGHETVSCLIPRRSNLPDHRGILMTTSATHKIPGQFVILAQSEYGDIYKYDATAAGSQVTELKVQYFDTIPVATAMCILKTGFLFAASESGDHGYYDFLSLGDDDVELQATSKTLEQQETDEGYTPIQFDPRRVQNLAIQDNVMSLAPMTDMKVANLLGEEVPQIFAACGRGPRSTLRMLRPGLSVSEVAVTEVPARPTAVWTVRRSHDDPYDDLIVISFADDKATLVLRVGDTVQEVNDSGLEGKTATIGMQLLGNNSTLQVHQGGLRHINLDRRINKWAPPGRRSVTACALNKEQVVIALSESQIIYFELNANGQLLEVEKKDMSDEVASLGIAQVPEGRQRAPFVVVGCYDQTVRVLSLEPGEALKTKATQTVPAIPRSVMLVAATVSGSGDAAASSALFLHIGLQTGVLIRTEVDPLSGRLSDQRMRFLGTRAPTLLPVTAAGAPAMMALSAWPWLGHVHNGKFQLVPLAYDAVDYIAPFASDKVGEGLVAVVRNAAGTGTLRVLTIDRLGEPFTQRVLKLGFTPRKLLVDEQLQLMITVEADQGIDSYPQRADLQEIAATLEQPTHLAPNGELTEDVKALEDDLQTLHTAEAGQWGSCIRLMHVADGEPRTSSVVHLDNNEAALCMCLVAFYNQPAGQRMLAVGTAKDLKFYPRSSTEGFVRLYLFAADGRSLVPWHKTSLGPGAIPAALSEFQGRLLVGCGKSLRLMECGRKKLLRKCEFQGIPNLVTSISTSGYRIYVGDSHDSFHFMRYKKHENSFYIFADDMCPRYVTCALQLDYDTMVGADKFGNVSVLRIPKDISYQVEEDPTGGKFAASSGMLNSAPHKVEAVANFHAGDLITSLQLCALQQGGQQMIVYGTISGGLGVLLPFTNAVDLDLFSQLEMHMRQLAPSLVGRDHLAFRSSFFPVRDVVDGDLCEQFPSLPAEKQQQISQETDRSPGELLKKLEDMRNKVL
eukprot:jgi/Ulvmu1/3505/UM162_0012.1